MKKLKLDICIIGAGSGGLSVAAGAAQLGASVALIEDHKMGGDCLNYGCVPSKALIAAAHQAHHYTRAPQFGIDAKRPKVDFRAVHDHVHDVIQQIAPNDSVERFEGTGVKVVQATGKFLDAKTVQAGEYHIQAKKFVIATGSSPKIPDLPGLQDIPYLTNETVFNLTELPENLLILGGGPIGCELGQAFAKLGSKVSIIQRHAILPKDDPNCVSIVRDSLKASGVSLFEDWETTAVKPSSNSIALTIQDKQGNVKTIAGTHILVAIGRQPNLDKLNLSAANIDVTSHGIKVDRRLRTSNKRVFAIGDANGHMPFTHIAGYHAGIVIKNILFRIPAKVNYASAPWCTYTSPELAQSGLNTAMAKQQGLKFTTTTVPFKAIDRALAMRKPNGLVTILTTPKGKILGATITGEHAGELIQAWTLAISQGLKIGAMANIIAAYPTLAEINKRVAGEYYKPLLFSNKTKKLVALLKAF